MGNDSTGYEAKNGFLPGDVFREYVYREGPHWGVIDDGVTHTKALEFKRFLNRAPRELVINDLEDAVRAEVAVEYWGGHIATSEQAFSVNESDWVPLPQPEHTPGRPECYERTLLGNPSVEIPLEWLKTGVNRFQFRAGPQIKYSFGWGFYWVYSFTVRVFYATTKPHIAGEIVELTDDVEYGRKILMRAGVSDDSNRVERVDFIAHYRDFDWAGNGNFTQWHYRTHLGNLEAHAGTTTNATLWCVWPTEWIPDQEDPIRVVAIVRDRSGMCFVTEERNVRLTRRSASVKMYHSEDIPERFAVRAGNSKECTIAVARDPSQAKEARLVLSTWSADHAGQVMLNDKFLTDRVGRVHNFSFDSLTIPIDMLKHGTNTVRLYSETEHHAAEVNWPGPVIMLAF